MCICVCVCGLGKAIDHYICSVVLQWHWQMSWQWVGWAAKLLKSKDPCLVGLGHSFLKD